MACRLVVTLLCMLSCIIVRSSGYLTCTKRIQTRSSFHVGDSLDRVSHPGHRRFFASTFVRLTRVPPAGISQTVTSRGLSLQARGKGGSGKDKMPRGVKKEHLPSKICVVCERPFTWRKKWERCWDEVTTCSKSCNAKRRATKGKESGDMDTGALAAGISDGKAF